MWHQARTRSQSTYSIAINLTDTKTRKVEVLDVTLSLTVDGWPLGTGPSVLSRPRTPARPIIDPPCPGEISRGSALSEPLAGAGTDPDRGDDDQCSCVAHRPCSGGPHSGLESTDLYSERRRRRGASPAKPDMVSKAFSSGEDVTVTRSSKRPEISRTPRFHSLARADAPSNASHVLPPGGRAQ